MRGDELVESVIVLAARASRPMMVPERLCDRRSVAFGGASDGRMSRSRELHEFRRRSASLVGER